MELDIKIMEASPQLIAAVRASVPRGGIAETFGQSLDQVWAFLRRHQHLHAGGHHLFLYEHDSLQPPLLRVDFGVQVVARFEQEGEVRCVEVPGGEVVSTVYRGPYARLPGAHAA